MSLLDISRTLSRDVAPLRFGPPVAAVYDPTEYALGPLARYVEQYGAPPKRVLLLGMNPGPWGMAQTGIPFGEVGAVRDWLGLEAPVGRPAVEHPKRPVLGFACRRSEVSGRRLWGLIRDRFGTPGAFFRDHFVANYCPLLFVEESGRNRPPSRLPKGEREPLTARCDAALAQVVDHLGVETLVGVGAFAADRARRALQDRPVQVVQILHPSPASPAANRGWADRVLEQLRSIGLPGW